MSTNEHRNRAMIWQEFAGSQFESFELIKGHNIVNTTLHFAHANVLIFVYYPAYFSELSNKKLNE